MNTVAPEGYSVSVVRCDDREIIQVHHDRTRELCSQFAVSGRVTEVYPSSDGVQVCAWCESAKMRWFISFDADQRPVTEYMATSETMEGQSDG